MSTFSPLSLPHEWEPEALTSRLEPKLRHCRHCWTVRHHTRQDNQPCELRTLRAQIEIARRLESAADAVIERWDRYSSKGDMTWFVRFEAAVESLRAARKGGG